MSWPSADMEMTQSSLPSASPDLKSALDRALGSASGAYKTYVERSLLTGSAGEEVDSQAQLLLTVLEKIPTESVRKLIETCSLPHDSPPSDLPGEVERIAKIFHIVGICATMYSFFRKWPEIGGRPIELGYNLAQEVTPSGLPDIKPIPEGLTSPSQPTPSRHHFLDLTVPELLNQSHILPHKVSLTDIPRPRPDRAGGSHVPFSAQRVYHVLGALESASISRRELNAYTLTKLANVRIRWTVNVARHLILGKEGGADVLDLFALPSFLASAMPKRLGIGQPLCQEIADSYACLFNAFPSCTGLLTRSSSFWGRCLRQAGWCLCRHCVLARICNVELRKLAAAVRGGIDARPPSELIYDKRIEELIHEKPVDWDYSTFPLLWSRIDALGVVVHEARPWSLWVLLRDSRDTLQFWTFCFVVVGFMFGILQIGLAAAQVASGFKFGG